MILITGATGTIGSEVVKLLADSGKPIRAMVRKPVEIPGVEVVQADFDDPASLADAVADVETVFLVTLPQRPNPDHDVAMVKAAREAGVQRVVKLSAMSSMPGTWHWLSEEAVKSGGMEWTILRPPTFASNMLAYADAINSGQPVPNLTGSAAIGIIDPRDVAAFAAHLLVSEGHGGQTYRPTGPDLLRFDEQVGILEHALGSQIATMDMPLDSLRDMMIGSGTEAEVAEQVVTGMAQLKEGHYSLLTDDFLRVLGRAPKSFANWVDDHAHVFRA
ncbi:NAD(P)H-binding protein [Streptomyces odonnellii]|uniref:NAD(P)H-binding protein n=1 Tax=Streptomyces odonnellii TaxID=1417980 RepID=UPI00062508EF|nr:NAD(P)H-binding protein [Streptomyces odonnellii]